MTIQRPVVPQEVLWAFKGWLQGQDVNEAEAASHALALPHVVFEPESRRDRPTRALWQAFQFETDPPALDTFLASLTAWRSRLLEVTLALCDVVSPLPVQRVLRLIARTGSMPGHTLKMTPEGLTAALGYGELHVTRHGRKPRWVVIDPALRAEIEALIALSQGRGRLAGIVTESRRADANSAAQAKLRRAWSNWCDERGLRATLTDLSDGIQRR